MHTKCNCAKVYFSILLTMHIIIVQLYFYSESQLTSSLKELSVSPPKTKVRGTRGAAAVADIM